MKPTDLRRARVERTERRLIASLRSFAGATVLCAALGVMLAPPASAQKATVAKVARITARVETLDRAARTVTVHLARGPMTFAAGPEVRGFDQVRTGDLIVVRYLEPVLIEVRKSGTPARGRGEPAAGDGPRHLTVTADVIGKDPAKRTVTLRWAQQTVELRARGAGQLKALAVGDRVEATYSEAAAISIELAVSRPSHATK